MFSNAAGNRISMSDQGNLTTYQYDGIYQLTGVDYPEQWLEQLRDNRRYREDDDDDDDDDDDENDHRRFNNRDPLPAWAEYVYDPAGNRLSLTTDLGVTEYGYDDANRMLYAGEKSFDYDSRGNRIAKTDGTEETAYTYDFDNRLTRVVLSDRFSTEYGYDALGRRVEKTYVVKKRRGDDDDDWEEGDGHQRKGLPDGFPGIGDDDDDGNYRWHRDTRDYRHTQRYLYDGLDVLQEITGRNNQKITAYYRANGQLVARQEYNVRKGKSHNRYRHRPHGRLEYYAHDGLDSIVALTNHRGKLRNQIRYDVYGGLVVGDLNETPYGFTGKRFDVESGLYQFHFRKYDPVTAVWTTEDPIRVAGGNNLYGYVRNNPVNKIDMYGLIGWDLVGTIAAGAGTLMVGGAVVLGAPAWVPAVGAGLILGGGAAIIYDQYSSYNMTTEAVDDINKKRAGQFEEVDELNKQTGNLGY